MSFLKGGHRMVPQLRESGTVLMGQPGGYAVKVLRKAPMLFVPMDEGGGSVAAAYVRGVRTETWDGTHIGVTWGAGEFLEGSPAPFYDGLNDYTDIFTNPLLNNFNGAELTFSIWSKVANPDVWNDGVKRYNTLFTPDGNNDLGVAKQSILNTSQGRYKAGGVFKGFNHVAGPVVWTMYTITASASADEARFFVAGEQSGATANGLGVWGAPLLNTRTVIGAYNTTPVNVYHGWLWGFMLDDRAWMPEEVRGLAAVP